MRERAQLEDLGVDGRIFFIWSVSKSMGKHERINSFR